MHLKNNRGSTINRFGMKCKPGPIAIPGWLAFFAPYNALMRLNLVSSSSAVIAVLAFPARACSEPAAYDFAR